MEKIGLGGGCHWCTEAVFQAIKAIEKVEQGWIASTGEHIAFSEAVLVHFDPQKIDLHTLIEIHLLTHSCTSNHTMRGKYRSAIYVFDKDQFEAASSSLAKHQINWEQPIITKVLEFADFKLNTEDYLNYYQSRPDAPFCKTYIAPKLEKIIQRYGII